MKQKLYITGLINVLVIFTGAVFKMNHWPGASIMLTLGIATFVLATIPLMLVSHYRSAGEDRSKLLHIITWLTCFIIFTSMLFKIMHWPYAGIALLIALPFPYLVFLPVFIAVTGRNKNFNIFNTVFVLLLLALNSVFATLLALNVSRQRISDSYNYSRNYNSVETILSGLGSGAGESSVGSSIDDVIKTVDEYEDALLSYSGITRAEWMKDPENLNIPDSRQVAARAMIYSDMPLGVRLEKELRTLAEKLAESPGNKELAAAAPVIFDIGSSDQDWLTRNFTGTTLSWSLIYLDGLRANLMMMKAVCN